MRDLPSGVTNKQPENTPKKDLGLLGAKNELASRIKDDFEKIAPIYSNLGSYSRYYDKYFLRFFPTGNSMVLDVGAGDGGQAAALTKLRPYDKWTLIDFCPKMIANAQQKLRGNPAVEKFVVSDLFAGNSNLPLSYFDLVICNKVLHDYPPKDQIAAIRFFKTLTKPHGKLILGDVTSKRTGFNKFIDKLTEFLWRVDNMPWREVWKFYFQKSQSLKIWRRHVQKEPKKGMAFMKKLFQENFPDGNFLPIHPHFFLFIL